MAKSFEIVREVPMPATPADIWDAITTGTAGWLWPMEYEPRQGGAAPFGGRVTVWDPPYRFVTRAEGEHGWFNQLEFVIVERDDARSFLRYIHSGVFFDDWDNQYDGSGQHTDFYLHTLGEYLWHFNRRPASHVSVAAPDSASGPDAFDVLRRALGVPDTAAEGDQLRVSVPDAGSLDAVADYARPNFLGLRTADSLYRFFGRNAFGGHVAVALHLFADPADPRKAEHAWQSWLDDLYTGTGARGSM